jgi:hypothetical protein
MTAPPVAELRQHECPRRGPGDLRIGPDGQARVTNRTSALPNSQAAIQATRARTGLEPPARVSPASIRYIIALRNTSRPRTCWLASSTRAVMTTQVAYGRSVDPQPFDNTCGSSLVAHRARRLGCRDLGLAEGHPDRAPAGWGALTRLTQARTRLSTQAVSDPSRPRRCSQRGRSRGGNRSEIPSWISRFSRPAGSSAARRRPRRIRSPAISRRRARANRCPGTDPQPRKFRKQGFVPLRRPALLSAARRALRTLHARGGRAPLVRGSAPLPPGARLPRRLR